MNQLLIEKYAYKKNKSVLAPHIEDIRVLLNHDATQKSILEYLKNELEIVVTQPYLSMFIKKHIRNIPKVEKTSIEVVDETPEEDKNNVEGSKDIHNISTHKVQNAVTMNHVDIQKMEHPYFDAEKLKEMQQEAIDLEQTFEEVLNRHEVLQNY